MPDGAAPRRPRRCGGAAMRPIKHSMRELLRGWLQRGPLRLSDRRRPGRMTPRDLHCEWGAVIDLSAVGLRLSSRHRLRAKPGEVIALTLTHADQTLCLKARVIWIDSSARFGHRAGLAFIDLTPAQQQALIDMARRTIWQFQSGTAAP